MNTKRTMFESNYVLLRKNKNEKPLTIGNFIHTFKAIDVKNVLS